MGISLAPTNLANATADDPNDPTKKKPTNAPPTVPGLAPLAPTVAAPTQPVDRVKLATDVFNTTAASTQGAYDAATRSVAQHDAAMGQIASGGLRTDEGNLALQRGRDLDTLRANLVNTATQGSVEDANTAFNQSLASRQLGLAEGEAVGSVGGASTLGAQTLKLQQQSQDQANAIARAGLTGILDGNETIQAKTAAVNNAVATGQLNVLQGQLALAQLSEADQTALSKAGLNIQQMSAETAAKAQAALDSYQKGQLSVADRDLALRTLAQSQSNTLATGQLKLAQLSEADQNTIAKAGLDISKMSAETAAAAQKATQQYNEGQITLATRDETLKELAQKQTNEIQTGQLQLQKDQLAQTGAQFGLSLAQQKDLATLADKTQNRQIDASTAQGQNALLVQLAGIMGADPGKLDPNFVKTIMKALGFADPNATTNTQTTTDDPKAHLHDKNYPGYDPKLDSDSPDYDPNDPRNRQNPP